MLNQVFEGNILKSLTFINDVPVSLHVQPDQFLRDCSEIEEVPVPETFVCCQHGVEVNRLDSNCHTVEEGHVVFEIMTDDLDVATQETTEKVDYWGPRIIAVAGNLGDLWGEQHRIETRTKPNHSWVNSGRLMIGGNYSRSPIDAFETSRRSVSVTGT